MPDTARTLAALLALYADNTSGDISPQDLRDGFASLWTFDPDALPASPHANDDEFRDGSIGGAWTDWDPASVYANSEDTFGLRILSSAGSLAGGGVFRDVPVSSDWTLTTKVSLTRDQTPNTFAGIFLAEDLTASPSTGDLRTLMTTYGGSGPRLEVDSWTAHGSFGSGLANTNAVDAIAHGVYLRIAKTSTTYRFMWSVDGVGWLTLYSTTSLGITPVKAGLAVISDHGSTARTEAFFCFWRQVDSAAYYAPVLGSS